MAENRCLEITDTEINEGTWFYPDRLRKLIDTLGISYSTLSKKSGVPEGTLRKLLQGETKDPRISTLQPVLHAADADANIVLGLAPARDYGKELNREGTLLADALRNQIEGLQQDADTYEAELARLRKLVLEKSEAKAHAESRVGSLEFMIEKRDQTITQQAATIAQYECRMETKRHRIEELTAEASSNKASIEGYRNELTAVRQSRERKNKLCKRLIWALCISIALTIAVSVYAVWEITNIDQGRTAIELEEYLEEYMANHNYN